MPCAAAAPVSRCKRSSNAKGRSRRDEPPRSRPNKGTCLYGECSAPIPRMGVARSPHVQRNARRWASCTHTGLSRSLDDGAEARASVGRAQHSASNRRGGACHLASIEADRREESRTTRRRSRRLQTTPHAFAAAAAAFTAGCPCQGARRQNTTGQAHRRRNRDTKTALATMPVAVTGETVHAVFAAISGFWCVDHCDYVADCCC